MVVEVGVFMRSGKADRRSWTIKKHRHILSCDLEMDFVNEGELKSPQGTAHECSQETLGGP